MQVSGTPAAITGTLFWTPEESGSTGLYIGAGVLCLLMIAGALVIRRRRSRSEEGAAEAW